MGGTLGKQEALAVLRRGAVERGRCVRQNGVQTGCAAAGSTIITDRSLETQSTAGCHGAECRLAAVRGVCPSIVREVSDPAGAGEWEARHRAGTTFSEGLERTPE